MYKNDNRADFFFQLFFSTLFPCSKKPINEPDALPVVGTEMMVGWGIDGPTRVAGAV